MGNTVVVVEHDKETIESADYIVDLGPKAGEHGGEICFTGKNENIKEIKCNSLTLAYMLNERKHRNPMKLEEMGTKNQLTITGAEGNNLKNINVKIPLG